MFPPIGNPDSVGFGRLCFYISPLGFLDGSVGKESACNAGDPGSIPGSGRSAGEGIGYPLQYSWASLVAQLVKNPPAMWEAWVRSRGEGKGYPLQYSCLENFIDCIVHGVTELDTTERLSLHFHPPSNSRLRTSSPLNPWRCCLLGLKNSLGSFKLPFHLEHKGSFFSISKAAGVKPKPQE